VIPEAILEAARLAADVMLTLVPRDTAALLLDEQAVKRANQVADTAEVLKFGVTDLDTP
jgi:ABC-type branched-subunit amino acid transport system ATPase component